MAALLASGTTVVCDRYYHSGLAYTLAKDNASITPAWARAPEVGLPRPDAVVFLDLDGEVAASRGGWGGERYERRGVQERVRGVFRGLVQGRLGEGWDEEREDLVVVDAGGSVEAVGEEIWRVVRPRVEEVEGGAVGAEVRRVS